VSKYYSHCCNKLPIVLIRSLHTCFTNSSPMPRFAPVTTHTVLAISLRAANDELAKCLGKSQCWNQRLDCLCCSVEVSTWSNQFDAHAVRSSRRMSTGVCLADEDFNQSINQFTFLVFGTHQGSQQTITGKTTYTKH